jgi:large subunit ribosomal protein L29
MKTKEKDDKKGLGVAELQNELRQTREKLFKLSFKHSVTPVKNPLELRALRRQIARLNTWISEKNKQGA